MEDRSTSNYWTRSRPNLLALSSRGTPGEHHRIQPCCCWGFCMAWTTLTSHWRFFSNLEEITPNNTDKQGEVKTCGKVKTCLFLAYSWVSPKSLSVLSCSKAIIKRSTIDDCSSRRAACTRAEPFSGSSQCQTTCALLLRLTTAALRLFQASPYWWHLFYSLP